MLTRRVENKEKEEAYSLVNLELVLRKVLHISSLLQELCQRRQNLVHKPFQLLLSLVHKPIHIIHRQYDPCRCQQIGENHENTKSLANGIPIEA